MYRRRSHAAPWTLSPFWRDKYVRVRKILVKWDYGSPEAGDGCRILVDRLWPRGLTKERLHADGWIKYISPSPEIRKAFCHREEYFDTFKAAYLAELDANPQKNEFIKLTKECLRSGNLTLLYAAASKTVNHAVILQDWLESQIQKLFME